MPYRYLTVNAADVRKGDVLTHPDVRGIEVIGVDKGRGRAVVLYLSTGDACPLPADSAVEIARW